GVASLPYATLFRSPPAGSGGAKTWAGGWGYAIPTASKKKEQAKKFINFMTSTEVAVRLAQATSFFVTARTSVMEAMADSPLIAALQEYPDGDHIARRPYHPQAARAETVTDAVGPAHLPRHRDLDAALAEGAERIAALS